MNVHLHLWLIPLLPFAGFLLNGILGARLPKWLVTVIGIVAPFVSFVWWRMPLVASLAWALRWLRFHTLRPAPFRGSA